MKSRERDGKTKRGKGKSRAEQSVYLRRGVKEIGEEKRRRTDVAPIPRSGSPESSMVSLSYTCTPFT